MKMSECTLDEYKTHFFIEKNHLEIEKSRLAEKWTIKKGDLVLPTLPNKEDKFYAGTLRGFV